MTSRKTTANRPRRTSRGKTSPRATSRSPLSSPAAREVLRRARSVPTGFVTTYGDLSPQAPRFAGAVMSASHDPTVPWHRVVRADGTLAVGERQRRLLEAEGVPFKGRRVDMAVAWVPAPR